MKAMNALRREIEGLLGSRPSLKRARQEAFLFLMFTSGDVSPLQAAGYTLTPLGPGRWGVEPPRAFYDRPTEEIPFAPGAAWQLYRMALTHPKDGDPAAARQLVKAIEAGETEACCQRLMSLCAQRLREKRPLPGYLAGWAALAVVEGEGE